MQNGQPAALEFPALLHEPLSAAMRKARSEGRRCAKHYQKHGSFPLPKEMRQVQPGECMLAHAVTDFDKRSPTWRPYVFLHLISGFRDAVEDRQQWRHIDALFEAFCLEAPWGALYHVVEPYAPRSAERMANRFRALLRLWNPLSLPRYRYNHPNIALTLDELIQHIYDWTLEAWCPEAPPSVREHLEVTAERMARATREDSVQAFFRMSASILKGSSKFKHPEVIGDSSFQRERLSALPPERFEQLSSACYSPVYALLREWDRELGVQ